MQREDDGLRVLAGGNAAVAFGKRRRHLSRAGRQHHAIEGLLGGVADGRLDIAFLDQALAVGIERELLDLRPRHGPVGAEPGQQQLPWPPA